MITQASKRRALLFSIARYHPQGISIEDIKSKYWMHFDSYEQLYETLINAHGLNLIKIDMPVDRVIIMPTNNLIREIKMGTINEVSPVTE